ncbi:MAG: HAMP domain-containing protein [Hyphomicrobium sp.]|uniref:HAMP domain-containing protein n=1 Tax=Hyphomicrobium sp. TaxID=82 RepID=UPI0039E28805
MSLQLRLNLAIAVLSALGLICMIAFILIDAKPRMDVENASTMLLTETLIRSSLAPLRESSDPKQGLVRLVGELKNLRHAAVSLASQKQTDSDGYENKIEQTWFSGWKGLPIKPLKIPVEVRGQIIDTIIITPRPGDEFEELLEAIFRIFEWGTIISAIMLCLTWFIINRSLKPVHALRDAMRRMSSGEFNLRVHEVGPPEIKSICGSLNVLAAALQKAQQDNQRLTANMIMIQDEERRDLARELHDELGPYLFRMRTDASLLGREFDKAEIDRTRARTLNDQVLAHLDLLQQTNRRVLERLTPAGLAELGLSGALRAMAEMWRRNKRDVDVSLSIDGDIDSLDETQKLTIYRVVQEGLTNAFRHSGASQIDVSVSRMLSHDASADVSRRGNTKIIIRDNGRGFANTTDGFGLKAMRERIAALSGSFAIDSTAVDGTCLSVALPIEA